jgi:hypothetical protein
VVYAVGMDPHSESGYLLDARGRYRILIRGTLDPDWSARLDGMTISAAQLVDGATATSLIGELADQSALVGVLNTLHDLGLSLVSVECVTDKAEGL